MQTADLYIRVSTDEQADKGYSLRYQEEVLRRYCEFKNITVRFVYIEDHSAKSFHRPQWNKLMINLHKHKHACNLLLFTKWDRFSRNTTDAYMMIASLNKLGVDPQAIEQPLDLSVPENKMMLAIYLAQPEVENHRRSLNIHGGMRRARKEGRFMGSAPPGYKNQNINGKKSIEIDPVQGPIMQWVFQELSKGIYTVPGIMQLAIKKGLTTRSGKPICKTSLWSAIRNPAYIGKIKIQAFKNEAEELVPAKHAPLISESLFWKVQDVLDGKKKPGRTKIFVDENFPLRGFLICPHCGKLITASKSKGRSSYYSYYHCFTGCNYRYKAEQVNDAFKEELQKWKPDTAFAEVYRLFLDDVYAQGDKERQKQIRSINEQLLQLQDRLNKARKMMFAEMVAPDDYAIEKADLQKQMAILEEDLVTLQRSNKVPDEIEQAYRLLSNIDEAWEINPIEWKRDFIGSMFPGKLCFDESGFRTMSVNEAGQLIFTLAEVFSKIEMGQVREISEVSHYVDPLVHFSNRFLHDLHKLAALAVKSKAA